MASNFNNENDPWEYSLDIDDSDLHLTPVLRSSSSARVEPSPYTPNPVTIIPGPAGIVQLSSSTCVEPSSSTPNPARIIPGPAGVVQRAKLLRENVFILDSDGALMSTQEYMQKVVEDVGEDDDFNSGAWLSATNYVIATGGTVTGCLGDINNFLKKGKLEQVVAIVKSCSPNVLGDLNVTMKDLSGTIPGTILPKSLARVREGNFVYRIISFPRLTRATTDECRIQSGVVGEAFAKHEKEEAAGKWREYMHEAKFIKKIVQEISLELRSINFGFDEKLVGIKTRVKDVVSSLEVAIDEVRMIRIKGMGGAGKTTTARAVRIVSNGSGLKKLQEQVLSEVLNEPVYLESVNDGKNPMKARIRAIKVLLVLDDVDHINQLEALAGGPNWFKPGKNPVQGYEELSRKVVRYVAGLPLTITVLGESKEDAIRILECCGFHARIGLKVLEQRSLITISTDGRLGMHDHIEEMGKNVVRRSHPHEPNKHSHLWIDEEIEDILANDMGTEETRCLKLNMLLANKRFLGKGLGKMKKLRYLEVSNLMTFDFRITPNLKMLFLIDSSYLVELCMPVSCQKLNYLNINHSKLRTFDLGLTPNLETLSLSDCTHFVELHVSVACPNLKFLDLHKSRLRSLDLELIPNLERLDLAYSKELVEINAPVGCLKKVGYLNLSGCTTRKSRTGDGVFPGDICHPG
ncbi:Toll/interleukin-1 receptor domain-containing protein, partial [Tanacetum coccineum]